MVSLAFRAASVMPRTPQLARPALRSTACNTMTATASQQATDSLSHGLQHLLTARCRVQRDSHCSLLPEMQLYSLMIHDA